jgi:hypothetical protein
LVVWFCIIGVIGQRGVEANQGICAETGGSLTNIRKLVEHNESMLSLIKMEYVVRFTHSDPNKYRRQLEMLVSSPRRRKPPSATPVSYVKGIWAQDDIKLYQSEIPWRVDGSMAPKYSVRVVDGELYKYGTMPELMQGTISKIEDLPYRSISPLRFGLRVLTGEYALKDIFTFENTSVHGEEIIDGRRTYIVDSKFPKLPRYIRTWIDQEAGVLLRAECYDKDLSSADRKLLSEIKNIQLHKLANGGWFPIKGTRTVYFKDEAESEHIVVDVNSIIINREDIPDSLFTLEFPDGARVYNAIKGINNAQAKVEVQSLVDKSMPDISDLGIKLDKGEIENKQILICFFDMNQRPSRNCIMQLGKKAQELKAKDVSVVTIQASKVEEKKKLKDWLRKNRIAFPVGIVQGDETKTRRTWGIKALPWLILTDTEHVVRAEGFNVNELDDKIKSIREK